MMVVGFGEGAELLILNIYFKFYFKNIFKILKF